MMASCLFTRLYLELIQILSFTVTCSGWELEKTIIRPIRQVVPRSSIRGFKDDYYYVDADVILVEGEIHSKRKPVSIAPHFSPSHILLDGQYHD